MLRFGETKVAKEEFYGVKKPIKICDNVSMLLKLIKTRTNSKYLNGY